MLGAVRIEDLPSYEPGMERGVDKGISQGRIESAVIFVSEMGLNSDDVARKLNIPVEEILKRLGRE